MIREQLRTKSKPGRVFEVSADVVHSRDTIVVTQLRGLLTNVDGTEAGMLARGRNEVKLIPRGRQANGDGSTMRPNMHPWTDYEVALHYSE